MARLMGQTVGRISNTAGSSMNWAGSLQPKPIAVKTSSASGCSKPRPGSTTGHTKKHKAVRCSPYPKANGQKTRISTRTTDINRRYRLVVWPYSATLYGHLHLSGIVVISRRLKEEFQ